MAPMRKSKPTLYVLLPLLYVGVVFFLIVWQFSKNESFSRSFGDIAVTGKTPTSGQQKDVLDLQLRTLGLQFFFSAAKPVVVVTEDGVSHSARPVSWSNKKNGVEVVFQYQFKLVFEKVGSGALMVTTILPPDLDKVASLSIPFSADSGVDLKHVGHFPLLEIRQGKKRLLLSLAGGQDTISDDNVIHLSARGGVVRPIRTEALTEGQDPVAAWLGGDQNSLSGLESALKDYWTKAYAAWRAERFNADSGTWDLGDGSKKYYEPLVGAFLREALLKGEYLAAFNMVAPGSSQYPSSWGFDTMPFLGNMMENTQAKRRQLEVLSSKDQIDWAANPRLWFDARCYGTEAFTARVEKVLLTGELPKAINGKLAFFSNLLNMKEFKPAAEGLDSRIDALLKTCLEGVLRQEGNLYLITEAGWLDLRSTLVLGKLLLKHSALYNDPALKSAGSQLILSALAQQDKKGFIPEILVLDNGKVSRQEGLLRPEDLYAALSDRQVDEVPLGAPQWSSGAFIRTPAILISRDITPAAAKFDLQFPTGAAEHLIIQGVPPFDHIFLHGIRWRTDPDFQMYSDGWYYNAQTQTLYVKIKHKIDREELVISFQP